MLHLLLKPRPHPLPPHSERERARERERESKTPPTPTLHIHQPPLQNHEHSSQVIALQRNVSVETIKARIEESSAL
jgi:hypothetical protein